MATRVVLDANVLAPGFVGEGTVPTRLLDLWRAGAFELVVSEHLLDELARTFTDPYFRRQASPERAARALDLLRATAVVIDLTVSVVGVATQPKDDLVLATCLSASAMFLATRDRQLLKLVEYQGLRIVRPGTLLRWFENLDVVPLELT